MFHAKLELPGTYYFWQNNLGGVINHARPEISTIHHFALRNRVNFDFNAYATQSSGSPLDNFRAIAFCELTNIESPYSVNHNLNPL